MVLTFFKYFFIRNKFKRLKEKSSSSLCINEEINKICSDVIIDKESIFVGTNKTSKTISPLLLPRPVNDKKLKESYKQSPVMYNKTSTIISIPPSYTPRYSGDYDRDKEDMKNIRNTLSGHMISQLTNISHKDTKK